MSGFLQALTFTTPLALGALLLLPVIWWLLRFTPPRPQTVRFPPLRLLLELVNREEQPDRTPWWLMALRLAIAALVIIGVAHPFYAPGQVATLRNDPLLLIVDDSWAAAGGWDKRQAIITELIEAARQANATVTLATSVPALRNHSLEPATAETALALAAALQPKALDPDRTDLLARLDAAFKNASALRVVWLSDGLDDGKAQDFATGLTKLAAGNATVEAIVPETAELALALTTPAVDGGRIKVTALRAPDSTSHETRAIARAGNGRNLGEVNLTFRPGQGKAEGAIELPIELRNDIQRIEIEGERNAAATYLMDDRWRRKSIGLMSGESRETAQPLLSPLYYVSRALEPYGEMGTPADAFALKQSLDGGLSMLILADIGVLPEDTQTMVRAWVERGGVLLRFAGPRLAGAVAEGTDPLLPVTLREGGRALGSALSWETPQAMQAFPAKSPFAGLATDATVRVSRQVLAEPDTELSERVWAGLDDGTPLVTARREGKGLVVLFHVTANADWSNLPISGLFVEMLRRVLDLAPKASGGAIAGAVENTGE
ncbi:MAG: BatA domain-containing protein, partial [Rhizobiales bacterium]|nr:BatA domain-containing protein [Hyphomicrobiales bacterium]